MKPILKLDMREFNTSLAARVQDTKRTLPEMVNQTAFNVAARAMRSTRVASAEKVRRYLGSGMKDVRSKQGTIGAVAQNAFAQQRGGKGQRISKVNSLRRLVLIAQAAFFKKHGHGIGKGKSNKRTKRLRQVTAQQASLFGRNGKLKRSREVNQANYSLAAKTGKMVMGSDYGQAMKKYAGKIFNKAVRSVGYLSALWVPILRQLGPVAKFKGLAKGLKYGVLWRTSSAIGQTTPAKEGTGNVAAVLDVTAGNPRMTPNAEAVVREALQAAMDEEAKEMRRHMEAKLGAAFA